MPIVLPLLLLTDLLSVGFILLDVYLFREWYHYQYTAEGQYARYCLYGAIALGAFSLFGRTPIKWLVSKSRRNEDEPKQEHCKEQEKLKRPDGSVINIEFLGDSNLPPLLFVHGWNANSMEWYYQKKYFSNQHRVILIDLPGLGKSTRPSNRDFSLQKMAADLDAVIKHLNLSKAVLWGHSIGGMVILTYCTQVAKDLPQRVRGIILQHTTFKDPTHTSLMNGLIRAIEKPVLYPICYLMIALSPVFWLSKWMSYLNGNMLLSTRFLTFTGTQTPAQLDFISRLSAMAPPSVFARGMLGMMKTYDVTQDLESLPVPALILGAAFDRLTLPVASEFMNSRIPQSALVMLSPAGHQGLVERHLESNEAARVFINKISSPEPHRFQELSEPVK